MQEHMPDIYAEFQQTAAFYQRLANLPNNSMLTNVQEFESFCQQTNQTIKYMRIIRDRVARISPNDVNKFTYLGIVVKAILSLKQGKDSPNIRKWKKMLDGYPESHESPPLVRSINTIVNTFRQVLKTPDGREVLQKNYKSWSKIPQEIIVPKLNVKTHSNNEKQQQEIPHILQSEIAKLDQKFIISLDSLTQIGKTIHLVCYLDDHRLPYLPPISVIIPEQYPFVSPNCSLAQHEYSTTQFLLTVQNALIGRIASLPKRYSLTQLLETWEMSVWQANSKNFRAMSD